MYSQKKVELLWWRFWSIRNCYFLFSHYRVGTHTHLPTIYLPTNDLFLLDPNRPYINQLELIKCDYFHRFWLLSLSRLVHDVPITILRKVSDNVYFRISARIAVHVRRRKGQLQSTERPFTCPSTGALLQVQQGALYQEELLAGCGCGSIGRAVASNTRVPLFKSSHRQNLYCTLFTVDCIEKRKWRKRGREWPICLKRGVTGFPDNFPFNNKLGRFKELAKNIFCSKQSIFLFNGEIIRQDSNCFF